MEIVIGMVFGTLIGVFMSCYITTLSQQEEDEVFDHLCFKEKVKRWHENLNTWYFEELEKRK